MDNRTFEQAAELLSTIAHLETTIRVIKELDNVNIGGAEILVYTDTAKTKCIQLNAADFKIIAAHLLTHVSLILTAHKKEFFNL